MTRSSAPLPRGLRHLSAPERCHPKVAQVPRRALVKVSYGATSSGTSMPADGLKRVYVFGLKSSVSEGKSARFTFSNERAHLANMPPIRFISFAAHAKISTGKGSKCWRSALCLPTNTNFNSTTQAMCHLAVLRKSPYVQAQVENLTAPNDWGLAP